MFLAVLAAPFAYGQRFTDVTVSSGISHVQSTAAISSAIGGEAFMAGGVAVGDFDGDTLPDLVFTRLGDTDLLYRNRGDGTFEARTAAAGFSAVTDTNGIASADVDNDGDLDLYMTTTRGTRNYLYLNDGSGVFTDAGASRVAALSTGATRIGQGVTFGDYDNDGYLDLFTSEWGASATNNHSRLLRNLGGAQAGHFEDVTEAAGLNAYRTDKSYRFAPRMVDLDRDGHLDLAIASDFETSQLFWNNGDGTFTDGSLPAGVGTDRNGMGSTFADYDNDGDLDWFITNITNAPEAPGPFGGWNRLYRNEGDRTFTDVTFEAGVRDSRWSWGTSFLDYDNDGDFDLVATNGYNGLGWADDRTFLWRNDAGVFTDVSDAEGVTDRLQGRGLAHLDYDNDGDLDLIVVNNEAAPILYRNDGPSGHFLRVDVEGVSTNRDGIGAWIVVTPDLDAPEDQLVWEVDGGSSFLSQNEHTAHFGLGSRNDAVDMIEVRWSGGLVQHLFDVGVDQTLTVIESDQAELADFNGDGLVNAIDYTLWRDTYGEAGDLRADASGDGSVNAADAYVWKGHYGRTPAPATPAPSPSASVLLAVAIAVRGVTRHARQR